MCVCVCGVFSEKMINTGCAWALYIFLCGVLGSICESFVVHLQEPRVCWGTLQQTVTCEPKVA